MKKNILFILLLTSTYVLQAQDKYGYRWQLLQHEYIDFNTTPAQIGLVVPQPFNGSGEFGTTMCDKNGNMIFQAGGCYILNKNLTIMKNGDSINSPYSYGGWCHVNRGDGTFPFSQSSIAVPYPQKEDFYIAFNFDTENAPIPFPRHLYYHIIDMKQENGLGAVIEKKKIAIQDSLCRAGLAATKHNNGVDWWVIHGRLKSNCYYLVKVTFNGVQTPIKYCVGDTTVKNELTSNSTFSPNGKRFAKTFFYDNIHLFDFDNSTGQLSNYKKLLLPDTTPYFISAQFSANNRYLYATKLSKVYQFNLEAKDIQASIVEIGDVNSYSQGNQRAELFEMRLAPDGKIYIVAPFAHRFMSVINRPNCHGKLCDFRPHAIVLQRDNYGALPNIPFFTQPPANYTCDSLPLNIHYIPETIQLYPNPSQGKLSVSSTTIFSYYTLYTHIGQKVVTGTLPAESKEIDVSALQNGLYFIQLHNTNKQKSAIGKFVIEK